MNSAGVTPASNVQKWQWEVFIAGFKVGKFTKSDLPKVEFGEVKHAPGGSGFDQKAAGRASFKDISLENGVAQDNPELDLMEWVRQVMQFNATGGLGAIGGLPVPSTQPFGYMRDVDIVLYNRAGKKVKTYTLYGAWPKEADFGELDGSSEDNVIEKMTLCFQYFDVVKA